MRAERMIKEYPNLKRELSVLEFQLSRCEGIDYDTVISSLTFSKPEGERVQTSGVSDVTARAALAYRKVADRMSDEWLSYLAGQYGQIKEELDFFEHAVRGLSGKLPEIVWDMAVERFTWEELMMKYHISHTMVAKYRKKAIKELDALYEERDSNGVLYYVYSRYTDENPNMKKMGDIILRQEDVLHIPGLGFDGLIGYSPIAMARNAVGMTMACEEYGASFFANGANPGGVLEHPGVLKDPAKVRDSWNAVYRGTTNAHKIAVLEEGMKYQQIGIPPEEAQFLETRKFQINEIARLFRIPPHMVGDLEKSSFSNIEQQSLEFVKYTLDPWVIRWEQALKKSLFLPEEKKEFFIKLNVDGLLRGDYQSRMNGYAIGRQNGWLSTNDIREMEDMNPLPEEEGGNLYLVNGAMTKLKDAGAFAKEGTKSTSEETEPQQPPDNRNRGGLR